MKSSNLTDYQLDQTVPIVIKRQRSSSSRLKQQQLKLELESKRIKIQVEQYQRQKEEELQQLQENMQLLEVEHELRQCGGKSERATVNGFKVHDVAKDIEVDNSFAGCEWLHGSNGIAVRRPN